MKKSLYTIVLFILFSFPTIVKAQLNHFIYLQTEGKQPFYAKLDKKILSSSATGYLIIPKLKEGTYHITIGFPKNEKGEQDFVCNIINSDAGYLVKNFGEKGWGLFNLQTLDVIMAGALAKENSLPIAGKTDEFSNMLSDVVNDPSIKQVEKPKAEVKTLVALKEEVKEQPNETAIPVPESKPQPVVDQPIKTTILKKQLVTGEKGTEIMYIDVNGNIQDTVNIFIPVENTAASAIEVQKETEIIKADEKSVQSAADLGKPGSEEPVKEVGTPLKQDSMPVAEVIPAVKNEQPLEDKKFLPIEISTVEKPNSVLNQPATGLMINSDCKNYATEEDFLKLRKKMAATANDDDMIAAAQKAFKVKCYTTEQVKNLSVLFLKDAGKYRFFDLSYQSVSDSNNFGVLEGQLTESYYISRFKAMIRH